MPFRLNLRALLTALLAVSACLLSTQGHAENQVQYAALSPNGRYIATIDSVTFYPNLMLQDADDPDTPARVLVSSKISEEGYWRYQKGARRVIWASNDLLVVDYGYTVESIDLDGKKVATLGEKLLRKAEPDNPDSTQILVMTDIKDRDLAIVDARSGYRRKFSFPMSGRPVAWAFDSKGELRALSLSTSEFWNDATTITNWYKPRNQADWQKLDTFKVTDNYWLPAYVLEEEGQLAIYSSIGRDTQAVFRYDTRTHQIGDLMAGHPSQDILAVDGMDASVFRSVVTGGMKRERYWFDETWARLQLSVDAVLPNMINELSGNPAKRMLIDSRSDVDPGQWYVLDIPEMRMRFLGSQLPKIDTLRERPMQIRSYPARDGLTIPAYLTLPEKMSGPQPTVIMIHGGPAARDSWHWDREVQALAGSGYVVFQPQFRGSDGFGRKFREAGYGQWGLAMQDDITDGVEYLIKEGIADPKRICIYGASYGGYAALWGLVKTPDLYRCGISVAGVSDIEYMLRDNSDSNDDKLVRELMRFRVGDAKLNKVQFDAVSPLKHADQIKVPVLLMHGENDERVPISHAKKMRAELIEHRKTYEWVTFEDEGHSLSKHRSVILHHQNLMAFLDKYIGPPTSASGSKPAPAATADAKEEAAKP